MDSSSQILIVLKYSEPEETTQVVMSSKWRENITTQPALSGNVHYSALLMSTQPNSATGNGHFSGIIATLLTCFGVFSSYQRNIVKVVW